MNDEKEEKIAADLAELTHECLVNILSRISLEDRWVAVMRVCKTWNQACKDPCLYSALNLDPYFDLAFDSRRFWTLEFGRRIDDMLRSVVEWSGGYLAEIRVRHCSDRALSVVAQRCPNLEVLSIKSCPYVTDKVMTEIASCCPKIKELDISYCYEISHLALATIGSHCSGLKILRRNFMNWIDPTEHMGIVLKEYLNACPQDGDSDAAAISKYMPSLIDLELRFSKLTTKGLTLISEGCLNLQYIDLFGCTNVTSRDIVNATSHLKNLKHIKRPSYIPRSAFNAERYGHWNLYDDRFQTDVFRF